MNRSNSLSQVYHGFSDPARPYSLVVRYGTRGSTRDDVERELAQLNIGPCATKDEALLLKLLVSERLRPYVDVSKFGGYL